MNSDQYKRAVISLLRNGDATEAIWDEVAEAVLDSQDRNCTPELNAALGVDDEEGCA